MKPPAQPLDSSAGPSAAGWRVTVLKIFVVATLALVALGFAVRWMVWSWGLRPFGTGAPVQLTIERGASLGEIARRLEAEGIIEDHVVFIAFVFVSGKQNVLQAGDFRFARPITLRKVLEQLQSGSFQRRLTVPEGWTAARIERRMLAEGWIEHEGSWTERVARPRESRIGGLDLSQGVEGFCFPETYFLEAGTDAEEILERMLAEFGRVWEELEPGRRDPRSMELSPLEVVTLASMIEREARTELELAPIASVYLNRLRIGMRLQCCATVHYALGEVWDRPLTRADLEVDSPFNTYRRRGLPPRPIGNPGRAAIEAVLRPADTPFLYYVYRGDGTHEFTRTYKEHLRAARRYRKSDPAAEFIQEDGGHANDG